MATYDADTKAQALALAEELGPAEAARRLNLPVGTVKTWMFRAGRKTAKPARAEAELPKPKPKPKAERVPKPDNTPKREPEPGRDEKGRWLPGVSGNPSGSTSAAQIARREAEKYTPRAIELLKQIAEDERQRIYARIEALKELLDRGLGRPAQAVTIDARAEHRYVYELTQRIVADPDAAQLADELLGRVAGDPGRIRLDRIQEALAAGEAPAAAESLSG